MVKFRRFIFGFFGFLDVGFGIIDPTDAEKASLWGDPNCDEVHSEHVDWPLFRNQMNTIPYPYNVEIALPIFHKFRQTRALDNEAHKCVMGLSTLFYTTTRWTLDSIVEQGRIEEDTDFKGLQQAISQYSVMENYLSAVHPGLLNGSLWPITDVDIRRLRQKMLDVYRLLTLQDSKLQNPRWQNKLKFYVYDEDEILELRNLTFGALFCGRGQWGMEMQIHDFFRASSMRTLNPSEADFFYVPGYAICMLEGNVFKHEEINDIYIRLIKNLPYFKRKNGRDHIFTFGSGMSTSVFENWRQWMPESIVLTPETELFNDLAWIIEPPFETYKDIVIPGNLDLSEIVSLIHYAKPLAEREWLGCFFGRADVVRGPHPWVGGPKIRETILKWKNGNTDLFISEFTELSKMHAAMGNSKFCFIPRGKSAWSLRFFESLFTNCVPVLLSDLWELPFEDFLDTSKFVIKWPAANTTGLLDYLRSIPDSLIAQYMEEARKVRCWYQYPPKKVDVRHSMRENAGICMDESQSAYEGIYRTLYKKLQLMSTPSYARGINKQWGNDDDNNGVVDTEELMYWDNGRNQYVESLEENARAALDTQTAIIQDAQHNGHTDILEKARGRKKEMMRLVQATNQTNPIERMREVTNIPTLEYSLRGGLQKQSLWMRMEGDDAAIGKSKWTEPSYTLYNTTNPELQDPPSRLVYSDDYYRLVEREKNLAKRRGKRKIPAISTDEFMEHATIRKKTHR